MVKHYVLWKLKDELTLQEKESVCKGIKKGLESLEGNIPGLLSATVSIAPISSSTADVMLECAFSNEDALKNYIIDSRHVEIANIKVRPFVKERLAFDTVVD